MPRFLDTAKSYYKGRRVGVQKPPLFRKEWIQITSLEQGDSKERYRENVGCEIIFFQRMMNALASRLTLVVLSNHSSGNRFYHFSLKSSNHWRVGTWQAWHQTILWCKVCFQLFIEAFRESVDGFVVQRMDESFRRERWGTILQALSSSDMQICRCFVDEMMETESTHTTLVAFLYRSTFGALWNSLRIGHLGPAKSWQK